MPTVIYADVLIGLNWFVNYFLLLAAARVTRVGMRGWRHLLASFGAACTALFILLPGQPWPVTLTVRIAVAAATVWVAFGRQTLRGFCKLTGAFFAVTFGFGGVVTALCAWLRPAGMVVHNGVVYYDLSPVLLVIFTGVAYCIIMLLRRYFGKEPVLRQSYTLHLQHQGKTVSVQAKLDTGFSLRDLYDDLPLVLVQPDVLRRLTGSAKPEKYRLLPYHSVGGAGLLPTMVCHRAVFEGPAGPVTLAPVAVAVSDEPFADAFGALIGNDWMERVTTQSETAGAMDPAHGHAPFGGARGLHQRFSHVAATAEKGRRKSPHRPVGPGR